MNQKVSIIIINWNTKELLKNCLKSIYENTHGIDYEIFVVDNASADGSVAMVRQEFPIARLIQNSNNKGYAYAVNKGIELATGDYILVLNSDIILPTDCVLPMLNYMKLNPKTGVIGPQLIYPDGEWQRSYGQIQSIATALLDTLFIRFICDCIKSFLRRLGLKLDTKPRAVGYIVGAAMLVKKELFDTIGSFDERFFFYAEDADFCLRAHKAGWDVVFVPQSRIIHTQGASSTAKERVIFDIQLIKANLQLVKKHNNKIGFWIYRFFTGLNLFVRLIKNYAQLLFLFVKKEKAKKHRQIEKLQLLRKLLIIVIWGGNVEREC